MNFNTIRKYIGIEDAGWIRFTNSVIRDRNESITVKRATMIDCFDAREYGSRE